MPIYLYVYFFYMWEQLGLLGAVYTRDGSLNVLLGCLVV